jgi:hypothetical protein
MIYDYYLPWMRTWRHIWGPWVDIWCIHMLTMGRFAEKLLGDINK